MVKKIYITGCARSGTTLLARLFYAFNEVQIINEETQLIDFISIKTEQMECKYLIGKRTEFTLFGNTLSEGHISKQLELIKDNKIIIINCIRDGRFVVDSWKKAWGMYDPFAWMNAIKQAKEHNEVILLNIKYEDLTLYPDEVQEQLAKELKLESIHKFSDYPEFVPGYSFKTTNDKYVLTNIENRNDIEPPQTYLTKPNDVEYFNEMLNYLGYVRN